VSNVQPIQFLAEAYTSILSDSFALFGSRPNVSWSIDPQGAGSSSGLWWIQPFDTGKGDELYVGAPEEVWASLATVISSGPGDPGPDKRRRDYLEFVRQTLSDLADALSVTASHPVQLVEGREIESSVELPLRLAVEVQYKDRTIAPMWFGCTSGFLSSIHRMLMANAAPASPQAVPESVSERKAPKYDMLLDVEMPVTVSFGKASLPLKDVMKLAVGSIVELNRRPAEPVDVIINNCVVARGEVVVVEGSYGLRLLEIIGEQERLSLR
jgi:flagellar motor switch protein FliN/FliY